MYKKIVDKDNLIKDTKSNAVLNIDNMSLLAYKKSKAKHKQVDERINRLEDSLYRIEEMLTILIGQKK